MPTSGIHNNLTGITITTGNILNISITSGGTVYHTDILVNVDSTFNLGTPLKRFRNINTVSGTSTTWSSTNCVITPNLHLGLDSNQNQRIITANNSVIQDDQLNNGTY